MDKPFFEFLNFVKKTKLLLIAPVITVVYVIFISLTSSLTIFPTNMEYNSSTYCDASEDGNTFITPIMRKDEVLEYSYTLKKGIKYPYAGLAIDFKFEDVYLDVSGYDYLDIEISADGSSAQNIFLKTVVKDFTKTNDPFTLRFLVKELKIRPGRCHYRIPLASLKTPDWWIEQHKIVESDLGKPNFNKTALFHIQNGNISNFNEHVDITLYKVAFTRDLTSFYQIIGWLIVLYYGLYFVALYLVKKRAEIEEKKIVIPYEKLAMENNAEGDVERISDCIAHNYSDPSFSVDKLAHEAGVSASKIPSILKSKFDMNFKQYLNTIRISEAKRLLHETDNQIVNIAYTVGYNNIPHFNRTFKIFEGISPKEYRKSCVPKTISEKE